MSDISAVSGTTPTTLPSEDFGSAALQGIDKDMFLKLLVAQMQYQDPMNPVDSSEFLNQAAQYASVEQLENVASQQAELRSLQMITVAAGMVGNEVTAIDPITGAPVTGVVESIQFGGSEPMLVIGSVSVPVSGVVEMRSEAPAPGPAAAGTPTDGVPTDGSTAGAGATASEPPAAGDTATGDTTAADEPAAETMVV